ncbi:hypothetical protein AQUCO_00100195v1 [Aquilegia coerulea]|uniref:Uncharacterized protein n=1 Tax=Aquilegia coerulea TaxID=218851 RepID=A0A2G5F953_AQUCA|nr:hypothetical protein AQUCO_00100195v1 [Aquilegia coerulea]
MGRAPCCDKANVKRGPWSPEEDITLKNYVERYGTGGNWIALPQKAGLKRCGKSCRLRWLNYLRPDIKHGGFTEEEDTIICTLYKNIGSRWSVIASQLKGRTDNDVKNYWNTKLKKKILAGKINLTGHNNIVPSNNHIQPNSSSSPAMLNVSPNYLNHNFTTMPMSMDVNVKQEVSSSGMVSDVLIQYPLPELMESLEFGSSSNNNQIISSSPEVSSYSVPSFDSNFSLWWPGNGIADDDRFLMDFGFGMSYDLPSGAGASSIGNYSTNDSLLSNTSDTIPQGLYQSITN